MTPRHAGGLTAIIVFTTIAALDAAVAVAQHATDAGHAIGWGGLAFSIALRDLPLAAAAGVLVACIAASRRGWRAASVAAVSALVVIGVWVWRGSTTSPRAPEEDPVRYALELVAAFATTGVAFAIAAAVITWWIVRASAGRDGAERMLALETASLHGSRDRWGAAMRAELASIDDRRQRARFARSAALLAFRHGTGAWPAVLAALAGAGAAVVVFSAARISFDRPRDRGIIGEPTMGLVLLLLVAAVIAGTLIGRSFRAGLETAVLASLAVWVSAVAVEIPQALAWYHDGGILLLDGEGAAGVGVDALGAALQPVTHPAFVFVAVAQLVIAVLAAGFAASALRVARRLRPLRDTAPGGETPSV